MFLPIYLIVLLSVAFVDCIQVPFIQNITLFPRYQWNSTTVTNQTIESCLCLSQPAFIAFNWFANHTCQLFYTFPITYRLQSTPNARLYFSRRIFPNTSQCCMPDLDYLLNKLQNGTWTYTNVTKPRNLLIDNHGYLVTVQMEPPYLLRYNAQNLTLIGNTSTGVAWTSAMTIAYASNTYFVGHINGPVMMIDSTNLIIFNTVLAPQISNLRSIIFLDDARTMVISMTNNNVTCFFSQIRNGTLGYIFVYQQTTAFPLVHGLFAVNDSFFYATSYKNNAIYSYKAVANSTNWIEALVVNASSAKNLPGGTFVTVDECGRFWYSLEEASVYVFNQAGMMVGNLNFGSGTIMDTLITDNYVMFFSDRSSSSSRIIRIDPHIQC